MAMFSLIYGSPAIPVLVNGIGVLMVFVACAHPANSVYSVVYSFTQGRIIILIKVILKWRDS